MSGEVMANSDGAAIDELTIREWFMHAELSEAIATHNIVEGILSMRQQGHRHKTRKKRSDAGKAHKSKTDEALPLVFDPKDRT